LSLNTLANILRELGQREAALQAAQEAADIRRELAAQRPDTFQPDLAASLNTLATMCSELGQREAALRPAQEAVDIRRGLAVQRLDAFRPDLARSLMVLALCNREAGHTSRAVPLAHEAITTLQPVLLCHRDAHVSLMLAMVQNYLQMCESIGQAPDRQLLQPLLPYLNEGLDDA
jgi:tetratricopeptide (TPR) repeat protein